MENFKDLDSTLQSIRIDEFHIDKQKTKRNKSR